MRKLACFIIILAATCLGQSSVTVNGIPSQLITALSNGSLMNSSITFNGTCGLSSPGAVALGATAAYAEAMALNAQTGTTYTYLATDCGKLVTRSNASPLTDTLTNTPLGGCSEV